MGYLDQATMERELRASLSAYRANHPENYRVPAMLVYDRFKDRFPNLTAGVFNKIIGDLKRIGVVGTTKNAEVFLSDAAWAARQNECRFKGECARPKGHAGDHQDYQGYLIDAAQPVATAPKAGA